MRKARVYFVAAAVTILLTVAAVSAGTAAASTTVDHFSEGPFPEESCGFSGTATTHGAFVLQETGDQSFFGSGTFWLVFTADNGKSITIFSAGPSTATEPVIDEQAGTVTVQTTFIGMAQKISVTNGPTLIRDAGTATITNVYEYAGDPDDPVGDPISSDLSSLHGPHPSLLADLADDFEAICHDLIEPVLSD